MNFAPVLRRAAPSVRRDPCSEIKSHACPRRFFRESVRGAFWLKKPPPGNMAYYVQITVPEEKSVGRRVGLSISRRPGVVFSFWAREAKVSPGWMV